MLHKLTLITCGIKSFLQKHSIETNQDLSLCILPGCIYSPHSFNISQNFVFMYPNSIWEFVGFFSIIKGPTL